MNFSGATLGGVCGNPNPRTPWQSLHARKWLSSFKRTKGYSRPYSMAAAAGLAGNLKESCGNRERVQEIIRKEKTLGGLQLLVMSARWHVIGIAVGHLAPSGARLTYPMHGSGPMPACMSYDSNIIGTKMNPVGPEFHSTV